MTEISDKDRGRAQAACVAYWAALGDHAPVRVEDPAVPGWLAVLDLGKQDADLRLRRKVERLRSKLDRQRTARQSALDDCEMLSSLRDNLRAALSDAREVATAQNRRAEKAEARVRVLEAEASQVNTPQSPVVLPEMTDEDARACCEGYCEAFSAPWAQRSDRLRWARAVQAVRDSLAARMPVWQPVEPGTVIKAGTRYRVEGTHWAEERRRDTDWTPNASASDPMRTYIDPRTLPAEPEPDPKVVAILAWITDLHGDEVSDDHARDLLARLDSVGGAQ